jgi:threonine/homoserine/homoserine lactone efflux protein
MPRLQTIALFMVSALVLNLTPGPAVLFILSRCFGEGREAAVVSVFGLATASVIHAVAAAFGLSALFLYWPLAFAVVKYCGAASADARPRRPSRVLKTPRSTCIST